MTRVCARVAYGVLRAALPLWVAWALLCAGAVWLLLAAGAPGAWAVVAVGVSLPATVIVHELGHALAAYALGAQGLRLDRIGMSVAVSHDETTPGREAVVAAAGPSLALAAAVATAVTAHLVDAQPLVLAAWVLGAGAYSLLPWTADGRRAWGAVVPAGRRRQATPR